MALLYIDKINTSIRAAFEKKVREIAAYLSIRPEWLMQVMKAESGLNSQAQNKSKADGHLIAAGLIQWTRASGLPGAPQSVLQKTALQQLDHVKEYFTPYKGKMHSYFDVYLVTFFPAAVGQKDNYIFQTAKLSPEIIAKQNPAINIIKDNKITLAEFKQYIIGTVPKTFREIVFGIKEVIVNNPAASSATGLIAAALFFF